MRYLLVEISFESTAYSFYGMSVELHDEFPSFTRESINGRTRKSLYCDDCFERPRLEGKREKARKEIYV
jgi:hypothetical protein